MANLKFKTRNNTNPQGKPRVYFCCHNEDFEKYYKKAKIKAVFRILYEFRGIIGLK